MNQSGYLKFIILLITLPLLGLIFLKPKVTTDTAPAMNCFNPDPNNIITYDLKSAVSGSIANTVEPFLKSNATQAPYSQITGTFRKIHDVTAIPTGVIPFHLAKAGTIRYKDQDRQVYVMKTECDGTPHAACSNSRVSAINFIDSVSDPDGLSAFGLLFVEADKNQVKIAGPVSSFIFAEIFLNSNIAAPDFIQKYCAQFQTIDAQKAFSDLSLFGSGSDSKPPLEINLDAGNPKITQEFPRTSAKGEDDSLSRKRAADGVGGAYQLIGFTPINSPFAKSQGIESVNLKEINPIKAIYKELNAQYYLGFVSYARYIILIDQTTSDFVYYYQKKDSNAPQPSPITGGKNLQLQQLNPYTIPPLGWWTPECKPAIYLYPQTPTQVQVKVAPKGFLTYTDPVYPADGWNVSANPNGNITTVGKSYDYLYYESKIEDSAIDKPTKGYVATSAELPDLFSNLLPKLGLNSKETIDFKNYWEKLLTSPYYFVGVMESSSIDKIEPLTIIPTPDSIIRTRLYFQPLDQPITVEPPIIKTPTRSGFIVVEWGGLVKNDFNHPFTCSQ